MTTKHTPGPWLAQKFEVIAEPGSWAVYANGAAVDHKMPAVCYGPDAKANAKLIAAAPALADALELALKHMFHDTYESDLEMVRNTARAALRAAGRLP